MNVDARVLLDKIVKDNKIEIILKELGMHHIKSHDKYFSCGMPDGDNICSTLVYKNTLFVTAYTRDISDKYGNTDLISLVMFLKKMYFLNAIKWVVDICGYDYYNIDCERPNILKVMDSLKSLKSIKHNDTEEEKLKPLDSIMLKNYMIKPSYKFWIDGINIETQTLFGISYDLQTHRIVIPIYDEIGNLVGFKGRLNYENEDESKYIYLHPMPKSLVLFGLDKTYEYIMELGIAYVAESEKSVLQAWSHGIYNVVAIGGKQLSKAQVKKLTHLGVEICLCYDDKADCELIDEEYKVKKDFYQKEKEKFLDSIDVSCIVDEKNTILGHKESPFDRLNEDGRWEGLLKMKRYIL